MYYIPSGCIALQVLALSFKHTCPNFGSGRVVFARVFNVLESAQRHVGIDKMRITLHKSGPFVVTGHSNRPSAKLFDC